MTVQTPALADFLLARIAEDEAVIESIDLDPKLVFLNGGGTRLRWAAAALDRPWGDVRTRLLAECDAKRRIVERASSYRSGWGEDMGGELMAEDVLSYLALPHADHPDYRQEWRP